MESDTMAGLEEKGYLRIDSLPSVLMEVNFASIEDYLKTLSRPRRKDMRRKLRRARDGGIEIRPVDNIDEIIDEIYGLYLKTYEAGSIKFEKLTRDFFARITRNISPYARYFLYYAKGKLAAFNLCFIYKDLFIDKS